MLPDDASQPVAEEGTGRSTPYLPVTGRHDFTVWIVEFPVDF
jgi:hypothetical protein